MELCAGLTGSVLSLRAGPTVRAEPDEASASNAQTLRQAQGERMEVCVAVQSKRPFAATAVNKSSGRAETCGGGCDKSSSEWPGRQKSSSPRPAPLLGCAHIT